jgi:hypothetical protein
LSELLVAWVVFPAVQLLLWFGCGSLALRVVPAGAGRGGGGRAAPSRGPSNLLSFAKAGELLAIVSPLEGTRPTAPTALAIPLGFCVVVIAGGFTTALPALAPWTTPVVVALAFAGLAVARPWRGRRPSPWLVGALIGVFAVYAAPIVLSGSATFAGYIKLDDTATWLALTDRVMEAGRSLDGLGPSSYEATLDFNLADGYPIGVFIPLGVGQALVGMDPAWLIQPYMASLSVLLAIGLWNLAGRLLESDRARFAVVLVAAQPALLYGYYLWGGIKEGAAAALIALIGCLLPQAAGDARGARATLPLALAIAALVSALSLAGGVWVGPMLLVSLVALAAGASASEGGRRALILFALVAAMSVPVFTGGALLPPTSSPLDDADASGNLAGPLSPLQALGIWPSGDFRFEPDEMSATIALCVFTGAAALGALVIAFRRRAWDLAAYLAGLPAAAVAIALVGSPWVDAKALAIASPGLLFAALLGAAWAWSDRRQILGAGVGAFIVAGVVWSNALAYSDVNLAPRGQLAELEEVASVVESEGPVLMTEYQPYGVRHFLRDADAEGASELRRRLVPLADGSSLAKGLWADTDDFSASAFEPYESLVLRRSPEQSRPPGEFSLAWAGDFYEVWERDEAAEAASARLPLGDARSPVAVPGCSEVRDLAATDGAGRLLAARSAAPAFVGLSESREGVLTAQVDLVPGMYEIWLEGSTRSRAEMSVDGKRVAIASQMLNNEGLYVELGRADLSAGPHAVSIELAGSGLAPGTGAQQDAKATLALRPVSGEGSVEEFASTEFRQICGESWDWVEAVP